MLETIDVGKPLDVRMDSIELHRQETNEPNYNKCPNKVKHALQTKFALVLSWSNTSNEMHFVVLVAATEGFHECFAYRKVDQDYND